MKASIFVKPSTWPAKQRHQHSSFIEVSSSSSSSSSGGSGGGGGGGGGDGLVS